MRFLILVSILVVLLPSCSPDENDPNVNEYPKLENLKFDVITSRNTDAIISRTLNNDTEIDTIESLPYSYTYVEEEVNQNTYLKLVYAENGVYVAGEGISNWTDYTTELKILVGNEVVKSEMFTVEEGGGNVQIDYTFE